MESRIPSRSDPPSLFDTARGLLSPLLFMDPTHMIHLSNAAATSSAASSSTGTKEPFHYSDDYVESLLEEGTTVPIEHPTFDPFFFLLGAVMALVAIFVVRNA